MRTCFRGKTDFSDTVDIRWLGVYIDVSQTKHGIMQEKISNYMPRVNTKLVNCNLEFATGPFYRTKTHKHHANHLNVGYRNLTSELCFFLDV